MVAGCNLGLVPYYLRPQDHLTTSVMSTACLSKEGLSSGSHYMPFDRVSAGVCRRKEGTQEAAFTSLYSEHQSSQSAVR